MTAGLDTWRITNADEWFPLAAHGPPNPSTDFDLNWRTIEGIPDLGGNAFHYSGESDITGIRVKPPPLGPHQFHLAKREEKKKKVTLLDPNGPAPDPKEEDKEKEKRPTSRRKEDRSKSCARYDTLRTTAGEPTETRGHHRDQERRGRSRNPQYLRWPGNTFFR